MTLKDDYSRKHAVATCLAMSNVTRILKVGTVYPCTSTVVTTIDEEVEHSPQQHLPREMKKSQLMLGGLAESDRLDKIDLRKDEHKIVGCVTNKELGVEKSNLAIRVNDTVERC